MKQQKIYITATLIILAVLLLSGCTNISNVGSTKILDILTNPGKYEGSEVTVSGKVIDASEGFGPILPVYEINDGSANISVRTAILPKIGDQVTVKGVVKSDQGIYIDTTIAPTR